MTNYKLITAYNADPPKNEDENAVCLYPDVTECPSCHHALFPKILSAYYVWASEKIPRLRLYLVCLCANCHQIFLCEYTGDAPKECHAEYNFVFQKLTRVVPFAPAPQRFPNEIKSLSPKFIEIYTQSEAAESQQLLQICGSGYRKALEFLVKDYLCKKYPDQTEKICKEFLRASIKRIEDSRIKTLAERSAWIGNDETHYVRNLEEAGLDEMKKFINATLHYIESELAVDAALNISSK